MSMTAIATFTLFVVAFVFVALFASVAVPAAFHVLVWRVACWRARRTLARMARQDTLMVWVADAPVARSHDASVPPCACVCMLPSPPTHGALAARIERCAPRSVMALAVLVTASVALAGYPNAAAHGGVHLGVGAHVAHTAHTDTPDGTLASVAYVVWPSDAQAPDTPVSVVYGDDTLARGNVTTRYAHAPLTRQAMRVCVLVRYDAPPYYFIDSASLSGMVRYCTARVQDSETGAGTVTVYAVCAADDAIGSTWQHAPMHAPCVPIAAESMPLAAQAGLHAAPTQGGATSR